MVPGSKVWAVVVLAATFAAGAAGGIAAAAAWGGRHDDPARDRGPRMSYIDRLDRRLDLRPEQRDSVAAILERHDAATQEIWRDSRRRFDAMRTKVRAEIMSVLNEEQRERLRAMHARSDSMRAARERENRRD